MSRNRTCRAATAVALLLTIGVGHAWGEERESREREQRYEVTIAPPRRPGSEPVQPAGAGDQEPSAAQQPDADTTQGAGGAASQAGGAAGGAEGGATSKAGGASASAPTQSAPSSADTPAAAAPKTDGPRVALQVGAFRQRPSAEKLRETLSATFRDVAIIDTTSGGEPLYRVRVGRLAHGPALEDIKRRLLAAGYPAFEVAASDPPGP